jgi:hypothetical protein
MKNALAGSNFAESNKLFEAIRDFLGRIREEKFK